MLAALLAWLRCLDDWPHPRLGNVLLLGLALGLALGVRVAGVLFAATIAFSILVLAAAQTRREGCAAAWRTGLGGSLQLLPAIPAALVVMAPVWPWVALAPGNFFDAIAYFGHFLYDGDVLFAGRRYPSLAVPITYWPTLLALTLPEAMLAGLLAALFLLPAAWRRHSCPRYPPALLTVAFAAMFPLAYAMLTRPPAYSGLRHFTFVLPPLAVLAALGFDALRHRLPAPARPPFAYALAALCLLPVVRMVQLHPYEYVYFNDLSGGLRAAAGRFELDYWGASFAELGRRLTPQLAAGQNTLGPPPIPARICGPFDVAQEVLPKSLLPVHPTSPGGRLAIAMAAFYCAEPPPGGVLAEVERAGVVLSRAYRVDPAAPITRDD
jgi:hypothetical protein